jgi:hypothetical protein
MTGRKNEKIGGRKGKKTAKDIKEKNGIGGGGGGLT